MKTNRPNQRGICLGFTFLLSGLVSVTAAAAVPTGYTIADLGAGVFPNAINDAGQVAGQNQQGGQNRAFLYHDGVMNHFLGNTYSNAQGLNELGHVVGYMAAGDDGFVHTFVYDGTAVTDILPDIPNFSDAKGINDSGQVVGGMDLDFSAGASPFLYDRAGNTLNFISGVEASGNTGAFAINQNEQFIVNYIDNSAPSTLYLTRLYNDLTNFIEIPRVPGAFGDEQLESRGINNLGHVTGISYVLVGSQPMPHAFLFDGSTSVDLGAGGGFGINDLDQVVGGSKLFDGTTVTDLNTLLDPGSGWIIGSTFDINNRGQIIGLGTFNGVEHGFLLTPTTVPVPAAVWLFGSAFGGLAGWRRKNAA